jgi:hypothetical protein
MSQRAFVLAPSEMRGPSLVRAGPRAWQVLILEAW